MKNKVAGLLAALLVLAGATAPVSAQNAIRLQSKMKTGTLNATTTFVELRADSTTSSDISMGGFGTVKVQTKDSYSGTWKVYCAPDGVNYDTSAGLNLVQTGTTTVVTSVTDTVGTWDVTNAGGCKAIRMIETAGFAATDAAVVISATQSGGGGSSSGGGGSSVSVVQGGNTLAVNASGQASVTCANCTGTGVSAVDNAAQTFGTSVLTPAGAVVDDVATRTVTENSAAFLRMTPQSGLHINLRTQAGAETGIAALPLQVSLANTAANATAVKTDGSAVTQPVSGTVTANMGTVTADPFGANADAASATGSISAKLRFIAATGIPITSSALPTGAATSANQSTEITSLQLIDDVPQAAGATTAGTKGETAMCAVTTSAPTYTTAQTNWLSCDTGGALRTTASLAGTTTPSDTFTNPTTAITTFALMGTWDGTQWVRARPSTGGSGTVDANTGRSTIATDDLVSVGIGKFSTQMVADGAATAGNPLYIGGLSTTSIVGQTPVSTAQRIGFVGGADRVLITRANANLEDRVSGVAAVTDGSSTSLVPAQGVGVRFCATNFVVSNSSATNVTVDIRDGTAGSVIMTIPASANMGGAVINLGVPLCTTANTAMAQDPSAAASTVTVTAVGFKTKL